MDEQHILHINEFLSQIPLYLEGLTIRNYSFPNNYTFQERIKKTLRIDINHLNQYICMIDYPQYLLFTSPDYEDILFEKQEKIIIPLSAIDMSESAIERVFHWNKFIFYNDNNSLTWLIDHDLVFLTQLIVSFGYDTNYKLNKTVLRQVSKTYFSSHKPFNNLFATKNNGRLEIRKGLIQFVAGNSNSNDNQLLKLLYDYGCHVLQTIEFTPEEKLQITAYIAYYIELCYSKYGETGLTPTTPPGSFLKKEFLPYPGAVEWLEKTNFYSLPGFAELVGSIRKKDLKTV